MEGIATVVVAWNGGRIRILSVPRVVITQLKRGTVFGRPRDERQHQRILEAALALLEEPAPQAPVVLNESL